MGYLILGTHESPETPFTYRSRYALVDQMGVLHDARRQGVGSKLLEEAIRWCSVEGIDGIQLDVRALNQKAVDFYAHNGFSTIRLRMSAPVV